MKGANSIKLFGNDLKCWKTYGAAGRATSCTRFRESRTWASVPHHRPAQPDIQIDRHECARYGINVADVEAVVQVADRRPGVHPDGRGREALRHRAAAARDPARRPGGDRPASPSTRPGRDGKPAARIPLCAACHDRPAQAGRVVHLPREQPALHPDQVQRAGAGPGLDDRRGPATRSTTPARARPARPGLRHRLVGRIRPDEASERSGCSWIVPISIVSDHDSAVHGVPVGEGRPAGHGSTSSRQRWAVSGR